MKETAEAQLQWLVDRAQISDLLYSFAAALDSKDWQKYADNFADNGYIELPDLQSASASSFVLHKDKMPELVGKSLGRYTATHHISTNHQITIDGDEAKSRSYLQGVHVGAAPADHWTAGGLYDCRYIRTTDGWKFLRVKLTCVWVVGEIGAIKPD